MPVLFYENYAKLYYSPFFSMSTCVCTIMTVFVVLLPFFAAFASDNFWTSISTFEEQPLVTFNNQFIMNVLMDDEAYFYSSVLRLNDYYDNVLPVPLVKMEILDQNNDNYNDLIKLKITFASDPTTIKNIKLMMFLNYGLSKKVKLLMQTMCLIDIDTPVGASYIYTNGRLNLKQKSPISSGTIAKTLYYTDIFQNTTSPYDFLSLYKEFTSRNLTTTYEYDKFVQPLRSNRETELEVEIMIPSYTTPIMLTLKMAWIQYVAIFIPIAFIIYLICLFMFKYQIFPTAVVNDLPKKII